MYLYGASGHARVIIELLTALNIKVNGLIDDNPTISEIMGIKVLHSVEEVDDEIIVSIGDCFARRRIVLKYPFLKYGKACHPQAIISQNVQLLEGTVVMAGAIIQTNSMIGRHCIINTGASVDHDCKIGDFVHVSPHVTLCGGVEIGDGTWVGAGSTVIQGMKIGAGCFIGAGSVIVDDIPDGYLCYGNPARIIRKL